MWQRVKFSKSHASGVVVLVFIVLFIQGTLFLFRAEEKKPAEAVNENPKPTSEAFVKPGEKYRDVKDAKRSENRALAENRPYRAVQFDPNTIDKDGLVNLGLSPKQAQVIINYRSKGGKFRNADDFSKMYVISPETYERLRNSISIDSCFIGADEVKPADKMLHLNSADSLQLVSLPGIGPYYARKIISYRERLGGFALKEQLLEIYGIDRERFDLFAERVTVDTNDIVKIDLKKATYEELSANPYIGGYVARAILRFREKSGVELTDLATLVMNNIIRKELFKILKYYYK